MAQIDLKQILGSSFTSRARYNFAWYEDPNGRVGARVTLTANSQLAIGLSTVLSFGVSGASGLQAITQPIAGTAVLHLRLHQGAFVTWSGGLASDPKLVL